MPEIVTSSTVNRSVSRVGKEGTRYKYLFEVNEDAGYLALTAVFVENDDITEVVNPEILQGVYDEQYQKWVNKAL